MPRKPPFAAASFAQTFRPKMAETFPAVEGMPDAMRELLESLSRPRLLSITERLAGLKQLYDEELAPA